MNNSNAVQVHWVKKLDSVDVNHEDVATMVLEYLQSLNSPKLLSHFTKESGLPSSDAASSSYQHDVNKLGESLMSADYYAILKFVDNHDVDTAEMHAMRNLILVGVHLLIMMDKISNNISVDIIVNYYQEVITPIMLLISTDARSGCRSQMDEIFGLLLLGQEQFSNRFLEIQEKLRMSLEAQLRSFLEIYHNAVVEPRLLYLMKNLLFSQNKLLNHSVPLIDGRDFMSFRLPSETRVRSLSNFTSESNDGVSIDDS